MNAQAIRKADPEEAVRAINVLVMAFSADPIMRWMWQEAHEYVSHFPKFVRGFGGRAFESGSAHVTKDFSGGSLWLAPGVGPNDEMLDTLLRETVPEPVLSEILTVLEQIAALHPNEPHWHLAFVGADPAHRGKGIGGSLLQHTLKEIDQQGLHAHLESSNPRNIPLYERHGFEVVDEIRVGGSPPVFPMTRNPR